MRCHKLLASSGLLLLMFLDLGLSQDLASDSDRKMMVEIARAVKRVKRNPFLKDDVQRAREHTDSDLRETANAEEDSGEIEKIKPRKTGVFQGTSNDYCDKFEQHFSFYCVGEVDQSGNNEVVLKKFCPSYKKACSQKAITSSVSLTSWPTDPFSKRITVTSAPIPKTRRPSGRRTSSRRRYSEEDSEEDEAVYYMELKKRYPCKPDCDRRVFAHCTEECKCDYIYPMVQRFCNPPPIPMFLNTCRLWYHGCPKYERYHYASQFVYSKADKGKVLPGTPEHNPVNPFNIPHPAPLRRNRALALAPIKRQKRAASGKNKENKEEEDMELIIPPPVPEAGLKKMAESNAKIDEIKRELLESASELRAILAKERTRRDEEPEKRRRRTRRRKTSRRRRRRRYHRRLESYEENVRTTTQKPATPQEVWRLLKRLNGITSGDNGFSVKSSPATLNSGGGSGQEGGLNGFLDYVSQSQGGPKKDIGQQWAGVGADPQNSTKEIVKTVDERIVQRGKENNNEDTEEVDFSKIKPRRISQDSTSTKNPETSKRPKSGHAKAFQGIIPVLPTDSELAQAGGESGDDETFKAFDGLSDSHGIVHTKRSRSPFTKPGLWEPNPADPHSRDPANKFWYHPESVGADWLNGQIQWGGHWAVPASGVGGTAGMSAIHFPTIGNFLNIPDDYD